MKELQKDLEKNELKSAYLFYGEESYLKTLYKKKLKEACIAKEDTINFNQYEGKHINTGEIIDLAETMPFFANRRLILMENTGFFKKSCDELADYIAQAPSSTTLLFVENEVDKRTRLYKAVKKQGRVVEFARQNGSVLSKWVLGRLKKEDRKISQAALDLFFQKAGADMENIETELEKLLCYTMNSDSINVEDVEAVCTEQTSGKIFDMIAAIASKRQKEALDLYYDLLTLKEPPLRILALLLRQFHLLLQVKDLMRLSKGREEIAKRTGLHSFVVGKYMAQTKQFTMKVLFQATEDCLLAEEEIKTGRMADKLSVELLIMKYSV